MIKSTEIRESYLIFPNWLQPFLTWLTGKPLPKQKPLFVLGPLFHFLTPMCVIIISVYTILMLLAHASTLQKMLLIPLLWLCITGGARKLALTVRHQCVHHSFTKNKQLDIFLAEIATTAVCIQDALSYKKNHLASHHKWEALGGYEDSHVKLLLKYGFKPGLTKKELWKHLWLTIISPKFHLKFTWDRLLFNFYYPRKARIILSVLFCSLIGTLIALTPIPLYFFLIAYIIPIVFLYNTSALLEVISEHPFVAGTPLNNDSDYDIHCLKTWGIMCGSPLPNRHLIGYKKLVAYIFWLIKMIGHFIIRLVVLCGDLSAHDLHHRKPGRYDWRASIYERQKEIETDDSYRDIWGFFNAIDLVFTSYSESFCSEIDIPQSSITRAC